MAEDQMEIPGLFLVKKVGVVNHDKSPRRKTKDPTAHMFVPPPKKKAAPVAVSFCIVLICAS